MSVTVAGSGTICPFQAGGDPVLAFQFKMVVLMVFEYLQFEYLRDDHLDKKAKKGSHV
jgi:hypothetical protein